jgi:predicted transcriptional regulator
MSETVTLELPDTLAKSVRAVAEQTHRRVEDVLIEWLDRAAAELPIELLPDDEVLALRDMQMDDAQQAALSELLGRQREGELTEDERARLDDLMGIYRRGMVRKAQALKVAVDRGLQRPLS